MERLSLAESPSKDNASSKVKLVFGLHSQSNCKHSLNSTIQSNFNSQTKTTAECKNIMNKKHPIKLEYRDMFKFRKASNLEKYPPKDKSSDWSFLDKSNRKFLENQIISSNHLRKINANFQNLPPTGSITATIDKRSDLSVDIKDCKQASVFSFKLRSCGRKQQSIQSQQNSNSNISISISSGDQLESKYDLPNLKSSINYLDTITELAASSPPKRNTKLHARKIRGVMSNSGTQVALKEGILNEEPKYVFEAPTKKKKSKGNVFSNVFTNRLIFEKKKLSEVQRRITINSKISDAEQFNIENNQSKHKSISYNKSSIYDSPLKTINSNLNENSPGKLSKNSNSKRTTQKVFQRNENTIRNFSITLHKQGFAKDAVETLSESESIKRRTQSVFLNPSSDLSTIPTSWQFQGSDYIEENQLKDKNCLYEKLADLSCSEYEDNENSYCNQKINLHNLKRVIKVRDIYRNRKDLNKLEFFNSPKSYKKEKEKMDAEMHKALKNVYHPILKRDFKESTQSRFKSVSGLYFGVKC